MATKERNEVARQFEEIFENWNEPEEREKHKLLKNRERRRENNREDKGL